MIEKNWSMIVDPKRPIAVKDLETIITEGPGLSFPVHRTDLYNLANKKWKEYIQEMSLIMQSELAEAIRTGNNKDYARIIKRIASIDSRYRLVRASLKGTKLKLKVGLTDFKEHMSTGAAAVNDPGYGKALERAGREDANDPYHYFSNPASTCVSVRTSDGHVVIGLRNNSVATYRGYYHIIGGFVKPNDENKQGFSISDVNFLEKMKTELEEELGLNDDQYFNVDFLGTVRNGISNHPEFMYSLQVDMTQEELVESWKTARDKFEHRKLCFVQIRGLMDFMKHGIFSDGPLQGQPVKFVPSGEANLIKVAEYYA